MSRPRPPAPAPAAPATAPPAIAAPFREEERYRLLAEFRHNLRRFLDFSERAAEQMNIHPQQYQLVLQVAGAPAGTEPTITYITERLRLKHNTVVELSKRCEDAGMIVRRPGSVDRRTVVLSLTPQGRQLLQQLAEAHARELHVLAPDLVRTLSALGVPAARQEER